jgi:hypothetical protein
MGIRDLVKTTYKILGKPCKYKGFSVFPANKKGGKLPENSSGNELIPNPGILETRTLHFMLSGVVRFLKYVNQGDFDTTLAL